ncbi:TetR/AcrR family transcriptional regulator [Achromobacter insuavis]
MRDQLLDIATDLFATQGVAATRLAHIAERAGFTSAMLHYYFKSRDQLLDAVVLERVVPVIGYVWFRCRRRPGAWTAPPTRRARSSPKSSRASCAAAPTGPGCRPCGCTRSSTKAANCANACCATCRPSACRCSPA